MFLTCVAALVAFGGLAVGQGEAPPSAPSTEYADLSRDQAVAVASAQFPDVVEQPAWELPDLPAGRHLAFLDDRTARVVGTDGDVEGLVVSSLPMRAVDDAGHREAVDLGLDSAGGGVLEPSNPLVDVAVHRDLEQGIELGDTGASLVPSGASAAADGVEAGSVAFFANAGTDTDFVVKPVATGFETFSLVRSADAPSDLSFRFVLPEGVSAALSADGQRVELRRDGRLLASVSVPSSYDAAGRDVETSWELDGDVVRVHVAHHAEGTVYPVVVDPVVDYYDWENGSSDNAGWSFSNPSGADFSGLFGTWLNGRGLYIRTTKSLVNLPWSSFATGQKAAWTYTAPGTSRIRRVQWNGVNHNVDLPLDRTCLQLGIAQSPAISAPWEPGNSSIERCGYLGFPLTAIGGGAFDTVVGTSPTGDAAQAHPGNAARFAVRISNGGQLGFFASQVGSAYVYLEDTDAPSITQDDVPSGWGDWPASREVRVSAHDAGLGVKTASLSAPGWSGTTGTNVVAAGCQSASVCAHDYAFRVSGGARPTIGNLPEGDNVITASAADPQQHATSQSIHVQIDRTAPGLTLSGPLYDRRQEVLAPGTYDLGVAATDADPAHATSGVRRLEVRLDGQPVPDGVVTQACAAGGCALTRTFALNLTAAASGQHQVAVTATDGAGKATTRTLSISLATTRATVDPRELDLTPRLSASLLGEAAAAAPGETVPYRIRVENSGARLRFTGGWAVENFSSVSARVAASYVTLESRAQVADAWSVVAASRDHSAGYTPHDPGPSGPSATLSLTPVAASGVSYASGQPVLSGTSLSAGARAGWNSATTLDLDAAQAAALIDAAHGGGVRLRLHAELTNTAGQALGDADTVADLSPDVATQDAAALHAEVRLKQLDGAQRTIDEHGDPALARIAAGGAPVIQADQAVPAVAAKSAGEADDAYLSRLQATDGQRYGLSAQPSALAAGTATRTAGGAPVAGQPRPLTVDALSSEVTRRLPVVGVTKSGPQDATPDTDVAYTVSLHNSGSARGVLDAVTDAVDGQAPQAVADAPGAVDAGAFASAQVPFHVPAGRAAGPLSDVASVRWSDAAGNHYGPVSQAFTTTVTAPPGLRAPALDLTVGTTVADSTSFLYSGANAVQQGVAPGTIARTRAAVIRGRVLDRDGQPLAGVTATVTGHPEYGSAKSQPDGEIYLAVNGGGSLVVRLEKGGFLPVERVVEPQWGEYAFLDGGNVRLTALDPEVTGVQLGVLSPGQVARGSVETDDSGSRRATLIFAPDTRADLVFDDGSRQTVDQLHVRATEYTVGPDGKQAMPGALPPQSAYTYAVDFTADEAISAGARSVEFSRPVAGYLENFLHFPVGTAVPAGYYDQRSHAWVAQPDGVIVKVLDVSGGQATLDVDGSGNAATASQLAALGITPDELTRVGALYHAGDTLWRTPVQHFTPWDWNFSIRVVLTHAIEPVVKKVAHIVDGVCHVIGSDIDCENQSLGESHELTGDGHRLDYRSIRTVGRSADNDTLDLEITPDSIPSGLKLVKATVQVAGRSFSRQWEPAPDLRWHFTWDRRDAFGRRVQGAQPARVNISYEYPPVYTSVECTGACGADSSAAMRFGRFSSDTTLGINERDRAELGAEGIESLGGWDSAAASDALGGWTLDSHHSYDTWSRTLHRGDGTDHRASSTSRVVSPLAAVPGAGNAAMAPAPDGSLYVVGGGHWNQIFRISQAGQVTLAAGNAQYGFSGDGPTPAADAEFDTIRGLAVGPDGSLYVSDFGNRRVRRVSPSGQVTTLAGNGTRSGRIEGAGTAVQMPAPAGLDVAPDGTVYVANVGYYFSGHGGYVAKIAPGGEVSRFLGREDGDWSSFSEGRVGSQTSADSISDVAVMPDGSVLVAEASQGTVRRIGADGITTRFAGGGSVDADGVSATLARLSGLHTVDRAPDGTVFLGTNGLIRRVLPDGTITTVAGTGAMVSEAAGKRGEPASQVRVGPVQSLAVTSDGSVYFEDAPISTVVRIAPPMPGVADGAFAVPSDDGGELYRFDREGRHLSTVDALTGQVVETFTYDTAGRLTSATDGDGNTTTVERDEQGAPTAIVGPYGERTGLRTDADGHLDRIVDPGGPTTSLSATASGLLTTLRDPRDKLHLFDYDAGGRLIRDRDPEGGSTALDRTSASGSQRTVKLTSALGRITEQRSDREQDGSETHISISPAGVSASSQSRENRVQATAPDGTTTSTVFGPDPVFAMSAPFATSTTVTTPGGLVFNSTEARTASLADRDDPLSLQSLTSTSTVAGDTTTSRFTRGDRTTTTTSPAGRVAVTRLDGQGRPTAAKAPGLTQTEFDYDSRGRLWKTREGTRVSENAYDAKGRLASERDPAGNVTHYEYDAAGRPNAAVRPSGARVETSWNDAGDLASITPPARPATVMEHDALGNLRRETAPIAIGASGDGETRYAYNDDHQLTTTSRPDGQDFTLGYELATGRLASLDYGDAHVAYGYDAHSRLRSAEVSDGQRITYDYDGSLPTGESWTGPIDASVSRTYDDHGRQATSTVEGQTVTYRYDADGLTTQAGALSLTPDPTSGLLTGTALGDVSTTAGYDELGELSALRAQSSGGIAFDEQISSRDPLGRVVSKDVAGGSGSHAYDYRYTVDGQLDQVRRDGVLVADYDYDLNGNRTQVVRDGVPVGSVIDPRTDQLVSQGGVHYAYDPAGDLVSRTGPEGMTRYQYDAAGGLRRVELPDGRVITYTLDAGGRRIERRVDDALSQAFLYDPAVQGPVAQLDASGDVVSRFVYATSTVVPDYVVRGGVRYRIVHDDLGSPRAVVNTETGETVERVEYDEFGRTLTDTNPGFQPFGYTGGLKDTDTGLVRLGARDYDPETGRFTTRDPLGYAGGDTNLYAYAGGDPINQIDPSGLDAIAVAMTACTALNVIEGRASLRDLAIVTAMVAVPVPLAAVYVKVKRGAAAAKLEREGIVYLRTDKLGGKPYVGQAKSATRYGERQVEHARDHPFADFEYDILGRAEPGTALDRLEEFFIRQHGGPTTKRNPGGSLANKRHQMSDSRYQQAGGDLP